jgi:ribosomal protein L37E
MNTPLASQPPKLLPPVAWSVPSRLRHRHFIDPCFVDLSLLRTGDCLERVGWSGKTFHILPQKYAPLKFLRDLCVSIDELIFRSEHTSPDEKQAVRDDLTVSTKKSAKGVDAMLLETDAFADHQRINRPDVLSDREWTSPTAELFIPAEWEMVEQIGMPSNPQPTPAPPFGAENYHYFVRIPVLNKRTNAKKEGNLQKKKSEKERLCAERKALFDSWRPLLRKEYDSDPHEKPIHETTCARCGGSWFNKDVFCRDCGWGMSAYEPHKQSVDDEIRHGFGNTDSTHDGEGFDHRGQFTSGRMTKHRLTKGRPRKRITPEEFVLGLMFNRRSRLDWLTNEGEWQKVQGTLRILVGGELAKDVAVETGEPQRTVEDRCEKTLKALREFAKSGAIRPAIDPAELILLHKLFPNDESLGTVIDRYLSSHERVDGKWVPKSTG